MLTNLLVNCMMLFSESLKVERVKVEIPNLPAELSGLKLVQLSDFHYDGKNLSDELLMQAIETSNAENPDLIVLTGDFVTDNPKVIDNLIPHLKQLQSKHTIYACLGNHDIYYRHGKTIIIRSLASVGIKVLWNQIDYLFQDKLAIVGLADMWSTEFNPEPIFAQLKPDTPQIVLSHNPDTMVFLEKFSIDLQLSGHTHGGQIVIPKIGPLPSLIIQMKQYLPAFVHSFIPYLGSCEIIDNWQWSEGYHRVGKSQMYVNRGLGTYFPGRLFCPPELTVITLG